MKKTLILTCALAIALTTSTAMAATYTKEYKGAKVTVTKSTPKYDKAVKDAAKAKADYEKAKKELEKANSKEAKAKAKAKHEAAKAKAKADAKAKLNTKINNYTNKKGVGVTIK